MGHVEDHVEEDVEGHVEDDIEDGHTSWTKPRTTSQPATSPKEAADVDNDAWDDVEGIVDADYSMTPRKDTEELWEEDIEHGAAPRDVEDSPTSRTTRQGVHRRDASDDVEDEDGVEHYAEAPLQYDVEHGVTRHTTPRAT